jgi:hypothetical protein
MADPVADVSRAAAQTLAGDFGTRLVVDVEEALRGGGARPLPDRYLDPVSLGTLIVSVATLAWTVFSDLKRMKAEAPSDAVAREVRVRLASDDSVTPALRDRIIDVVVSETVAVARPGREDEAPH